MSVHYRSTTGLDPETFIDHFRAQSHGKTQRIQLVGTSYGGGVHASQRMVVVNRSRSKPNKEVAKIQMVDPVSNWSKQAEP